MLVSRKTRFFTGRMDRLSVMWERFSLSDAEGSRFVVQDSMEEGEFFVAARFYTG